jgi:hypothetical protein
METTLNQIIEKLQHFANRHELIRSFGYGTQSMLNSFTQNNDELPLLYSEVQNVNLLTNTIEYDIKFTVIDSRTRTTDNLKDVLSDTAQIMADLRKYLIYGEEKEIWALESDSNILLPLINTNNDWLTGWSMTVTITTGLIQSDCNIPII